MNQVDLLTYICKVQGIFKCHITATDNNSRTVSEKGTVAGRAIRNTHACQLFLSRNMQFRMMCSCSNQNCPCFQTSLICIKHLCRALIYHFFNFCSLYFCSKVQGMFLKFFAQVKTADFRKPRVIIDFIGRQDLSAADTGLFQNSSF